MAPSVIPLGEGLLSKTPSGATVRSVHVFSVEQFGGLFFRTILF